MHDYANSDVNFELVYVDESLSLDQAKQHAAEFGYHCPVIVDGSHTLVRKWDIKVTPEVAVVSQKGDLLYHGRIDDTYTALTIARRRTSCAMHSMRSSTIERSRFQARWRSVVPFNKRKPHALVHSPHRDSLSRSLSGGDGAAGHLHQGCRTIVYQNCVICHRQGEVAPFSLMSGVVKHGAVVAETVDNWLSETALLAETKQSRFEALTPVWELVDARIRNDGVYPPSWFTLLVIAGVIGAIGILTNSQILVVAAMVVGPEYGAITSVTQAGNRHDGRTARRDSGRSSWDSRLQLLLLWRWAGSSGPRGSLREPSSSACGPCRT